MRNLIIIRGLPGSGKSTLAKILVKLGYRHFEADMYHYKNGKYDWQPTNLSDAHNWCQQSVRIALENSHDVVVSNTCVDDKALQPYLEIAESFNIKPLILMMQSKFAGNIHNVPEDVIENMTTKLLGNFGVGY